MLDIAENCFMRIAEAIKAKGLTVRGVFSRQIIREETDDGIDEVELLTPVGFLEGVKHLGIRDFKELDVACLMKILSKSDLEDAILLQELIIIMENFGINET